MEESAEFAAHLLQKLPADAGLLLVGHGTREPAGTEEFLVAAQLVAQACGPLPLEPCFLEFAEPTIAQGVGRLLARGARRVVVVPVLLFSAGHAKRDIPEEVSRAASNFCEERDVELWQAPHLGCQGDLLALSRERYDEALAQAKLDVSDSDTWLVLVGRGSTDAGATEEMHEFARLRQREQALGHVAVGFVAMALPKFTDVLEAAATSGAKRIVVQPHLLFGGVLLDRISRTVNEFAQRFPQVEWLVTPHLGPAPQLTRALLARSGGQLSPIERSAVQRSAD